MRAVSSGPVSRRTPGAHSKPQSPFSELPASRKPRANTAGYQPIAPSVEIDPSTGSFKRRPAHIRALEESKQRSTGASNARRTREQSVLVDQAHDSCIELRTALAATAARMDFTMLDRIGAARGDASLSPLRQQLDNLVVLSLAFAKFTCPTAAASLESRLNGRPAAAGNALRIKTVVVTLRALTDKLSPDVDAAAAFHIEALVEQGLLEQIFSWASESESTYDILLVARPPPPAPRAPVYPPSQRAPGFGGRSRSAARNVGGQTISSRAPIVEDRAFDVLECKDAGKDDRECYRERLGRCRPARLMIPEVPEKKGH